MKKMCLALLALIMLPLLASPALASPISSLRIDTSQSYLRLGSQDTINVTVQLMDKDGQPVNAEYVVILLNFINNGKYVDFDKQLIATDAHGTASTTIRLNPDNEPEPYNLPLDVMVTAQTSDYSQVSGLATIYITGTGQVAGYVLDDQGGTITSANMTVRTSDGKLFPTAVRSGDGSGAPMGYYRIEGLPLMVPSKATVTATKNGHSGSIQVTPSGMNVRNDITIHGYVDTVNVSNIVNGNTTTPTPLPSPAATPDVPAKPTSMTTTILIAIVLITLVYIGLRAYRRMF